jgi:gliding motility-associated-like protein
MFSIKYLQNILLFFVLLTATNIAYATHNRAGEITYRQINLYTYEFTLVTYTYAPSAANEDRDYLTMDWGDGSMSEIKRIEITPLPDEIQKNVYIGTHTFPGIGVYEIVMSDPNRNADIVNIPGSVNVVFSLKTTLLIDPNLGFNNTPVLQNPPVDKAALGRRFVHNPSAYDSDGDSLSYEITVCLAENGNEIQNYEFPDASDSLYVDPVSGDFVWDAPTGMGEYNVAMKINEWRNGVKIGSIIRDMQIEVDETDNLPPEIDDPGNFCVTAGENISFSVSASDPDNDRITLTAYGGPFTLEESPAVFNGASGAQPVEGEFSWNTVCSHIRKQPYSVIFRAIDDSPEVALSAYSESQIQVVAPAPENLEASPSSSAVYLSWDSYACSNALGFLIYRKYDTYNFEPDECETGMPEYAGYTFIDTLSDVSKTEYIDTGLAPGYNYCYRIVAYFDDGSESYVSNEACAELVKGTPVFLNSSVETTDLDIGAVSLRWMNPVEFDQTQYPGPYKYILEASEGLYGADYTQIAEIPGKEDTVFTESSVDTQTQGRSYRLSFYSQDGTDWEQVGSPAYTSTVFAKGLPDNRRMTIQANENTPWTNYEYTIYRKTADENCTENSLPYDSVGTSASVLYTDYNLSNDEFYWYKIRTIGAYGLDVLPDSLVNYSQEICVSPQDTIPPCPVELSLDSDCDLEQNYLNWQITDSCASDIELFRIYYTDSYDKEYQLLETIENPDVRSYIHKPEGPMGACYVVVAQDSAGNFIPPEELLRTCIDICHYYELPNVFTPDNDGVNDRFIPFPYNYVEKIELKVYNRWGNLVFQTENPDINWDGTDMNSGKALADGVYYYLCDVYEKRLSGIEVRNISGFVHIFANEEKQEKP